MNPTKRLPLFVITGASGVGKSTMSEILFANESDYIVMESDLLWNDTYNTPDDGYRKYRELWLSLCSNISQVGMPTVLCGCAVPQQFEVCNARNRFTWIYYLAVVSDDDILEGRMRNGRGIVDDNWVKSSVEFNAWLKENANKTNPNIKLLDNSNLTPQEAAKIADAWIRECMAIESC